jgi:hypothetical protein
MIAALSPLLSWAVIGVVLFISVGVYAAVVAGGRADEWAERTWQVRERESFDGVRLIAPGTYVRIYGGVYDYEASGDFHDPVRDHEWCDDCNARLRRAFNQLADHDLGPRDADDLMGTIRRTLDELDHPDVEFEVRGWEYDL